MFSVFKQVRHWMAAVGVCALAACGSGGGGGAADVPVLPPVPVAPVITVQPALVAVSPGQTATFSVTASGTGLVYQWRRNGSNIAGANSASYAFAAALGDNDAVFSVVVSNLGGIAASSDARLTVGDAPVIVTQPANQSVLDGAVAQFQVAATGTAPFTYLWRRNGQPIAGATGAIYSTPAVAASDSGATFTVEIGNGRGSVTSSAATLTVLPAPPAVVRGPEAASVVAGNAVTFSVFASGTAPFSYQWRRAGVAIPGATQSTYSLVTSLADDAAQFSVVVTNSAGSATSDPAVLSVFAVPQAITVLSQPQDLTVRDGERPTFTVVLSGTGPFSVVWMRNGVDMSLTRLDNVSSTTYSFSLVRATIADDNGALFSFRITNAFGSVTSRQALLTVVP